MPYQMELPEPWFLPEPAHTAALEREAAQEIGPDHELANLMLTAIAKCAGCDEVLFQLEDATLALVHLTWAQHPERSPWPATRQFASRLAAKEAVADHASQHVD